VHPLPPLPTLCLFCPLSITNGPTDHSFILQDRKAALHPFRSAAPADRYTMKLWLLSITVMSFTYTASECSTVWPSLKCSFSASPPYNAWSLGSCITGHGLEKLGAVLGNHRYENVAYQFRHPHVLLWCRKQPEHGLQRGLDPRRIQEHTSGVSGDLWMTAMAERQFVLSKQLTQSMVGSQ